MFTDQSFRAAVCDFKLPSGHLLLTCGIYHPPKPTHQPADFLQDLTHLMDNALDQHPG